MSRKRGNETDTIHAEWWDEDETVTIRRHLTHGMQKHITAAYASMVNKDTLNPADPTSVKVDVSRAIEVADTPLLHWIVSWTLKDANGNILPPTQAMLDELLEEDIAFISSEIEKRSQGMTEEEKKGSSTTPQDGTEG